MKWDFRLILDFLIYLFTFLIPLAILIWFIFRPKKDRNKSTDPNIPQEKIDNLNLEVTTAVDDFLNAGYNAIRCDFYYTLQQIFAAQYELTFDSVVETRYRTETKTRTVTCTDPETGETYEEEEEYEEEVPYDYYIRDGQ